MQPILITTQYPDLYRFLAAMQDKASTLTDVSRNENRLLLWSPEARSTLLDGLEKLELIEHYARKLNIIITLSAASDLTLREMAHKVGWQVLWEMPGLDAAIQANPQSYNKSDYIPQAVA